jgi:hypothetical protein
MSNLRHQEYNYDYDPDSDSDSDSDSSSTSSSSSSSSPDEEEYEEYEEYEDDPEDSAECKISNEDMPKLSVSCLKQHLISGKKCFKNKCLDVIKFVSVSNQPNNVVGNIVEVSNGQGETYFVKWNRYKCKISEFKYEVRVQKAAHLLGLAPQILQIYEQEEEQYVYIFMTDLIRLGYRSITEYFGLFKDGKQIGFKSYSGPTNVIPQVIIIEIANALKKLHSVGIAHGNVYPGNVFTDGKKIVFIEYGRSEMYPSAEDAWKNEKFSSFNSFITSNGTQFVHLIPINWKDIKQLSSPY